jgi:hypothetical protein
MRVVFRLWLDGSREGIALLPDRPAPAGHVISFELPCGESPMSLEAVEGHTRQATGRERAPITRALCQHLNVKPRGLEVLARLPRSYRNGGRA